MSTLCFLDAFNARKSGKIDWDQYLRHLLIHFTGVKHKEDSITTTYPQLRYADPFGYDIFCWNQEMEKKVEDIAPFEAVFQAYRAGSVTKTKEKIIGLDLDASNAHSMRRCLAFLALRERRAKILEMCYDLGGFTYEAYFVHEAWKVEKTHDPETHRVLADHHFFEHYPPPDKESLESKDPAVVLGMRGRLPVDW